MALPTVPVVLPPANPYTGGLYDAATLIDDLAARHLGGLTVDSPNHGPHGSWPTECPTPGDTPGKGGPRPAPRDVDATIVWAADECNTVGITDEEAKARAAQALRLAEQVDVEKHAATDLKKVTATQVADIVAAVAHLEQELTADGFTGVIHARRGLLAVAEKASMIIRQGSRLLTPGGHRWAFGAGYTDLGDTVVGTGPVIIRRSPVTESLTLNARTNTRMALAERVVAVAWDTPTAAATITSP
ncbi:hypothetical protein ACFORJ_01670 [Corynebacterium hansenii]|uniref:Uncharacterized protein n=1 Tax=Corynebacterium hansenii TaxID=394964 RepID=A0ABV7ZK01_9CORY|nr:hypothetical protein [Corynebacterium hansenii]WJY99292.1 hypothetical protein CHAN_03320 [Corynebacterium hansenii]